MSAGGRPLTGRATDPRTPADPGTPPDLDAELRFALDVAEQAGRLLLERFERVGRVSYKSARDVVTEVDHLSEDLILTAIKARFPEDGILAEESGEHVAAPGRPSALGDGRRWVVDPLDGTINYANGIPFYCVSIALVIDGRPVLGVIRDPIHGEAFAAAAGGPATLDGLPVTASSKERLSDFVISMALSGRAVASRIRAVRRAIRVPRSMGSAALALAYVANGRFDAFIQQGGLSAWDVAAAGLIAHRAGAQVTDLAGGPWFDLARTPRSIGIVAAPPTHHEALRRLVA